MDSSKKFKGSPPDTKVSPKTKTASSETYDKLRQDHINDYHSLFNRVELDLGTSSAQQKNQVTNVRKNNGKNQFDPDLEEMLFQFGRYLLISASRGSLPANLQVI